MAADEHAPDDEPQDDEPEDPFRRWARRAAASMPPMSDTAIANTAEILRRVDARRRAANQTPDAEDRATR